MPISFAFMKIKTRRTVPGELRCAESYLYTRPSVRAYATYSWLIVSQPLCMGKEQSTLVRIIRG